MIYVLFRYNGYCVRPGGWRNLLKALTSHKLKINLTEAKKMTKVDIKKLGFSAAWAKEAGLYEGLYAGRVAAQSKDIYRVISENGEIMAEVSGKLRFAAKSQVDFPAVGDFVMLDRTVNTNGNAVIHHVLSRKSAFIRKAAGTSLEEQIVASNIDLLFICMSLNNDFNLRRLERYLAIGWNSGAVPLVVLTKADLCFDLAIKINEVESVCPGVDIVVTSALQENSYSQIIQYLKPGQTVAFIGSSGVGKSTLINCLLAEDRLLTNGLRNDDKGRHTTTMRELILLKNGAMVIDTPGMRELGLENADLTKTFTDIVQLASQCRFSDCTHTSEPGCAVRQALDDGRLSQERFLSYQKLQKEIKYDGLNSRQIEAVKMQEMFSEFAGVKNARRYVKKKNKRR